MSENQENLPAKSEPAPSGTGEHTLKQSSILIGSKERVEVLRHQSFAGPIPHPALLQQYNQCVEGGAHRIIRMAEAEGDHRRAMEMLTVQKTFAEGTRGQYCAAGIACLGIVGAVYLGSIGMQWAASIVGGTSLVLIVLAFLKTRQPEPDPAPPEPVPSGRRKKKRQPG